MDYVIDKNEFSFFCKPYYLKLQFPCECVEDERCKAVYDINDVFILIILREMEL